jgi:polysaccharide biosynthesis transport protein
MEFRDVVSLAWKRRWLVLLVTVATVGLGAALAFTRPDKYQSTATVAVTPDLSRGNFVPPDTVSALVQTYAQTAKSDITKRKASALAGSPLRGEIKTGTNQDAGILTISGRADTPEEAKRTAQFVSRAFLQSVGVNRLVTAQLVDAAGTPSKAVEPRPPLILIAAFLLGLTGGVLLAVAVDQLRNRVETAADLSEITGAPVIGRLPRRRALGQNGSLPIWRMGMEMEKLKDLQEAFRALRTNLEFVTKDGGVMLQVTSPLPAQGKSTVVANLGIALAQIGLDTVIVDADLRRPIQHRIFQLPNERGLTTRLVMGNDAAQPLETEYRHLLVLPSGPIPQNSTELLHIRFQRALDDLKNRGATILVDSAPLLPISDGRVIAPRMDGVILVVEAGAQKPQQVRSAIEHLELAGANLIGVVLNRTGDDADGAGYDYHRYAMDDEQAREAQTLER